MKSAEHFDGAVLPFDGFRVSGRGVGLSDDQASAVNRERLYVDAAIGQRRRGALEREAGTAQKD
jgi:hypothetical protein